MPLALEAMQTEHEADRTTSLMMDAAEAPRLRRDRRHAAAALVEVLRGLRLRSGADARAISISAAG